MFRVEHAHHLAFFNDQYGRGCNRRGRPHTNILACQAPLTKEVAGTQYPYDSLFADLVNNRQLYAAILNVHHTRGRIALSVDLLRSSILHNSSRQPRRIEKSLHIESALFPEFYPGFGPARTCYGLHNSTA